MKVIAIITARGGSKRIPGKNIKDFLGKPIIAYSIQTALDSKLFDEVMVSTDDNEIFEISKKFGASISFLRSEKTSNDYATTADVLIEVIEEYKKRGKVFDYVCCIYPTAPFITSEKLNHSFKFLIEKKAESLIPIVRFSYPIQRALRIENDSLQYIYPENRSKRSQDLERTYHDAGQFYWIKTDVLINQSSIVTDNSIAYEISELEVQDIDSETDWKIAEMKYQILNK
jgi:N-acylneuraminate cytidylyltransferase